MNKYIDAHTHNSEVKSNIIKTYIYDFENKNFNPDFYHFFIGIHPWFIEKLGWNQFLNAYHRYSSHKNFLGIGEIGLDKINSANFEAQLAIFKKSCQLAKENKIQRIVIHNIKADQEIIAILKETKFKPTILLHDYNSHVQIFKQFDSYAVTYISIGSKLFTNAKIAQVITQIPINKILLETDDQTQYNIKDIYVKLSNTLKISETKLKEIISENYQRFIS